MVNESKETKKCYYFLKVHIVIFNHREMFFRVLLTFFVMWDVVMYVLVPFYFSHTVQPKAF